MSTQPTPKKPPNQSRSFFLAAERCMEQRRLAGGQFEMPLVPAVVCLAFSIELGLKAIATAEGTTLRGHELAVLFRKLSPHVRAALVNDVGLAQAEFDAALAAASDTFVDWRYVHEETSPQANIAFLRAFARAVQKALTPIS